MPWLKDENGIVQIIVNTDKLRSFAAEGHPVAKRCLDYAGATEQMCSNDAAEFALWLYACCDRVRGIGVTIFDLGDRDWRSEFEAGASPAEAVRSCIEEDDLGFLLRGGE